MNITIESASSGALYVLLSGVISATISGLVTWLVERKRNDTSLKEMAVKLGLEEFALAKAHVLELRKTQKVNVPLQPPAYFVYVAYIGLKDASKLSTSNQSELSNFWMRNHRASEALYKSLNDVETESHNESKGEKK